MQHYLNLSDYRASPQKGLCFYNIKDILSAGKNCTVFLLEEPYFQLSKCGAMYYNTHASQSHFSRTALAMNTFCPSLVFCKSLMLWSCSPVCLSHYVNRVAWKPWSGLMCSRSSSCFQASWPFLSTAQFWLVALHGYWRSPTMDHGLILTSKSTVGLFFHLMTHDYEHTVRCSHCRILSNTYSSKKTGHGVKNYDLKSLVTKLPHWNVLILY